MFLSNVPVLQDLLKIVDAPVESDRVDQSYKRKAAEDDEGEFAVEKPSVKVCLFAILI